VSNADKLKRTRLNIREDEASTVSSTRFGHNLDTIGFNMTFLKAHDLSLALAVMQLYEQAKALEATVPGTVSNVIRPPLG
jgi:hypothetical protein